MKNYKILFFDIDDTILDYKHSEFFALKNTYDYYQLNISFDTFNSIYHSINDNLWKDLQKNRITPNHILEKRWSMVLQSCKIENINDKNIARKYKDYFINFTREISGTSKTLKILSKYYKLSIITNGFYETQSQRLKKNALLSYFDHIITPENSFACKPSKKIFDFALSKFPEIKAKDTLMIGDNYYADIIGASRSQMDSCFISNKNFIPKNSEPKPTFVIKNISDLLEILI